MSIGRSLSYDAVSKGANEDGLKDLRVTSRLYEVDTRMDPVIHQLCTIHPIFLLQVGVETRFNVVDDRLPSIPKQGRVSEMTDWLNRDNWAYASSLLTKSPNPGVSTTVNLSRTPFSSMSIIQAKMINSLSEPQFDRNTHQQSSIRWPQSGLSRCHSCLPHSPKTAEHSGHIVYARTAC